MSTHSTSSTQIRTRILQASEWALDQLAQRALALTPPNYAVFFAYGMGHPPEIKQALDKADSEQQTVDDAFLDALYQRYLSEGKLPLEIDATSAVQLHSVMDNLFSALDQLRSNNAGNVDYLLQHMHQLQQQLDDSSVREFATSAMETAMALKADSDALSVALAESKREIEQLRQDLRKRTLESERDFLTGAYNRKAWDERIHAECNRLNAMADTRRDALSIAFIDIDHFKQINDSYGHAAGDEVIRQVARFIIHSVKGKDMVARIGGEEFALLLPETPIEGAVAISEYIRSHLCAKPMCNPHTGEGYGIVTVSIGVATLPERGVLTADKLQKQADDALYAAKNSGRNCVHY